MKNLNSSCFRKCSVYFLPLAATVFFFIESPVDALAEKHSLKIENATLTVVFTSVPSENLRPLLLQWVTNSARAVESYYGQFPVQRVEMQVELKDGQGISSGETFGWRGARIKIAAGRSSSAATFSNDWEMTHEMVHLAFPTVAEKHHWIEEGLATYVEPIARVKAGNLAAEKLWGDMIKGMPKGLPEPGDRGLDLTPTWGRTYWGGALFCLMADVEIRQRTRNRKGLEDSLRAILEAGGNITEEWELERALKIGDRASGVPVLREIYDQWKATPVQVNLPALWKNLGLIKIGKEIKFDDSAPMASIRRAITAPTQTR